MSWKTAGLPLALGLSVLLHLAVLLLAYTPTPPSVGRPLQVGLLAPVASPAKPLSAPIPALPAPEAKPVLSSASISQAPPSVANSMPMPASAEMVSAPLPELAALPIDVEMAAPADTVFGLLPQAGDESQMLGWNVYVPARLLDGPSLPLEEILLPEPDEEGAGSGEMAEAEIRVYVNERGEVDGVDIVRSEPPGVLDDIARAAFSRARFEPGMQQGRAVRHYKRIVINKML
ncbi:TonB family protein [Rhodobacteraceae bacterium CH30]|nr:TonB family protein [Rhodobacteraceae bacterium CH30]